VVHTQRLQQAVEERALLSPAWRKASSYSDWALRLTPERAAELVAALAAVVAGWEEDAGAGPATGEFVVQLVAFPEPGTTPATTAGDRQ
jgi:hypothetical protein